MRAIIIYYSRTGNTEKAALTIEKALTSAGIYPELEKIKPLKTRGYIKSVLMALLKREAPILNVNFDMSVYDYIFIGGPVCAASTSAPLNSYLEDIVGISGKRTASFVTMAKFGGNSASRRISQMIISGGGKYMGGMELTRQEIMDDKTLKKKVKGFVDRVIK